MARFRGKVDKVIILHPKRLKTGFLVELKKQKAAIADSSAIVP